MDHGRCERDRYAIVSERTKCIAELPLACVAGSSIICVDLLLQKIPRMRNFRIQESSSFLSASLSLTFGVMVSETTKVEFEDEKQLTCSW